MCVIDGFDGLEACYHFAGIVGVSPERMTLRELWRMAVSREKHARSAIIELASLVGSIFSGEDIDLETYHKFGRFERTGAGGPVELSPELAAKVEAEIERLREQNPSLPKVKGTV